ncbi:MAG: DNA polymerase III subunit chi [Gammaproteobacteria bacterium]|nr:DNA polymerase III subunit chi [Gammaproteobacteria bacterium]
MQVDFYILGENSKRDINGMVCRLCEKALAQNMNVLVYTKSSSQAQQLDELLWTFKANSFIAHKNQISDTETVTEADSSFSYPVLICTGNELAGKEQTIHQYQQLLINLTTETPEFLPQFERVAELVGKDNDEKEIARNRYRTYREKGYNLNKYDL